MGRLRAHVDERGATAVLVGVLLPALLAFAAVAFGTLSLAGGDRELQRAADAGALATASRLPLVDVTSAPGLADLKPGLGLIRDDVCQTTTANLAEAPMHRAFSTADPTCSAEHRPFGAQLSDALQAGLGVLPGNGGPNLHPLLDLFDLPALLPGVATPYVEVTVGSEIDPPLRQLVSPGEPVDLEATAVARRRIKNAVLVPAVDASALCDVQPLVGNRQTLTLGETLAQLGTLKKIHDCYMDPNHTLAIPREPALDTLDGVADTLANTQLAPVAPLVRELRFDVADVYNPPTSGDVPTQWDLIEAAAADDEDVLVILANPISGGGGLLSNLIGASAVPILDVLAVPASTLANCDLNGDEPCVTPADAVALSQGRGLFRASLVDPATPGSG